MPKPLVSEDPKPKDPSFSHFGVLDDGKRSKGSIVTSTIINGTIILFLVLVSALVKTNPQLAAKIVPLYVPPAEKKPPPPKPPPPPPKPPVDLPKPPKLIEQPKKIDLPKPVEMPPEIKPMPVPVVKPVQLTPPAPKAVAAMAAPKVVNMNMAAKAASIANNDPHPTAVRAGFAEIKSLNGPAVAKVNIGGGIPGMPSGNTGNGPKSVGASFGNGSPSGTATKGGGVVAVKGLPNGVPGGTGTGTHGPVSVGIAGQVAQAAPPPRPAGPGPLATPVKVTAIPKAERTAEAKAAGVSGDVRVSVVFHANGTISVGNIVGTDLGHGLSQVARNVAAGIRFTPAKDASGNPVEFPTIVTIHFLAND